MPTLKNLPWVSLSLLLVTYTTLGRLLIAFDDPVAVWVAVVIGVFLLSLLLSSPWSRMRDKFAQMFKTDSRAFLVAVIAAFATVLIVSWFHIFFHAFVIASATILFRLDAQKVGWNETQIFWVLIVISFAGLVLGALVAQRFMQ